MAGPNAPAQPPQLSRRRPAPTGDEEATTVLKLGDMADTPALSVAECKVLLDQLAQRGQQGGGRGVSSSDVYVKTREYVDVFARFKDPKTVTQVDAITAGLLGRGLGHYERAQLATLCCDTPDEARTLIPSLEEKLSDEELQDILNDISKLRDFS